LSKVPTKHIPKVVRPNVRKHEEKPITDNFMISLIRQTCVKIVHKKIASINDVTSKAQRLLIQTNSVKGMKQKWLFDTGAGLVGVL
jgi:hypothetical protein